MQNEIGRELKASELVPRTVYVLHKEGRPYVTNWFVEGNKNWAHFLAGDARVHMLLEVQPDDTLQDDDHMKISVFEYLGEV